MIDVYIDANIWNYLFENRIDLKAVLPPEEFRLLQTREAEFENRAIPDSKNWIKEFIVREIERCNIQTISIFGFDDEGIPERERRFSGFAENTVWITPKEKDFRDQQKAKLGKLKKSGLLNNEADISIAAKSLDSVILTLDRKKGPIKEAAKISEKVIYLKELENSGKSLRSYIYEKDS